MSLAALALAVWLYLVFARGWFWLGRERDDAAIVPPAMLPPVAIVVPARNEADNIAQSVTSLLRQDYPAFSLVLVDDDSDDGTADVARRAAAALGAEDRLTIVPGAPLPPGWTGKLWAVKQGIAAAEEKFAPKYLMLTDADIVHAPDTLSWLVAQAEANATRAHLADGALALRESGRARAHPGLHLLLPDALSVRLGEPAGSSDGGRGRRLHAGARGRAARGRRHRRHSRRADRRLRARRAR